ncbi:MAG: acyltransferase family protein [Cardiobacteriaceae bacterium]|nr:acyltransferase family protein [Cardiobacteriaceae bacterium]
MSDVFPRRYYYGLDTLRAVLMLVGVLWHAASIVSPLSHFVYSSTLHKSFPIYAAIYPEHLFRMEAFFLVSGFLSQMILLRKGKGDFFRARVKRVLIPLVLGCFGVNFLLQLFGSVYMGYRWEHFDMWRWVMHGWFLITLFMCALIDLALPRDALAKTRWLGGILVLVIAWFGYVALGYWNAHLWHFWDPVKGNLFNFFILNTVQFYPLYFFGALLFHHQDWLERLDRRVLLPLALLTFAAALIIYLNSMQVFRPFGREWYSPLAYRAVHLVSATGIAFLLFVWCHRMRRENGRVVRYLIDSAIVIYLLHHPLVIVFGWAFDSPALGNLAYFSLVVAATFAASYLGYALIRRMSALRFAFGLR